MTVSSTNPSISYAYVGPDRYDFGFKTYLEEDISVYLTDTEGLVTTLIRNVDYTVTIDAAYNGGYIDVASPVDAGGSLNIRRVLAIEQPVDWINNDPMDMETLELSLDRMVMILQQQEVVVTDGNASTSWRGDWEPLQTYYVKDTIVAPNNSLYVCIVEHVSTTDFDTDLAAGNWQVAIDVEYIEQLTAQCEAYALAAENSALAAAASELAAATSASEADASAIAAAASAVAAALSEANASTFAQNAANCATDAYNEAERAEDEADRAQGIADSITGVPAGGLTGEVLGKASDTDYDLLWTVGGGGGGGGLDWTTVKQTASFTAENGKGYFVDTRSGSPTVTFPATPSDGDRFALKDQAGTWGTFNCLSDANGSLVEGASADWKGDQRGQYVEFSYEDDRGWLITATSPMNYVYNKPYMQVQDRKSSGSFGGSSVVGHNKRDLNSIISNDIPGASLSNNEITLPAGTYYLNASAPTQQANTASVNIQVVGGDYLMVSTPNYDSTTAYHASIKMVSGKVTFSETTAIQVNTYHTNAVATVGLGGGIEAGDPWLVFTSLEIWKLDSDIKSITVSDPEMYLKKPLLFVREVAPVGQSGADAVLGANDRIINTTSVNEVSGSSLNATTGEITLPAGQYWIEGFTIGYLVGEITPPSYKATLEDTSGNVLINSSGARNYDKVATGNGSNDTLNLAGRVTLLTETTVKVIMYASLARVGGMGSASSFGTEEVYTSLRIWQEDAVVQAPYVYQPVNQPVTGAEVTGNIFGGELVYVNASQVDVNNLSCMDDTLQQEIIVTNQPTITIAVATVNTIFSFFAVRYNDDTYGVEFDFDINGSHLPATVTHKRWIGFVKTNSSGDICGFTMSGDSIAFHSSDEAIIGTVTTTPSTIDHSAAMPVSRIVSIEYGGGYTTGTGNLYATDGTTTEFFICGVSNTTANGLSPWGNTAIQKASLKPYRASRMFTVSASTTNLLLQSATLRR